MPSLDFPSNPTDQQTYTLNGITYQYNASIGAWLTVVVGSQPVTLANNKQVLYSNNGLISGTNGLVYDNSANTLHANTVIVAGSAIPSGNVFNLAYATANAGFAKANAALANTSGTFAGNLGVTGSATVGSFCYMDVNGIVVRTGGGNYGLRIYPGGGTDTSASILQFTNAAQNAQWGSLYQSNTSMGIGTDLSVPLYFRTGGTNRLYVDSTGHVLPAATNTYDLGSSSARWRNIFTQDLHLSNGIGDYTIVEGEEELFLYNNKTQKVFKFALIEVDPSTAPKKMDQ
jgi:hypothetical protein